MVIEINSPDEWGKFSDNKIDFIPDPMVLRTAELFFNGRSGCAVLGISDEDVWNSISLNIDGLLAFFDILMTRDNIPLIQYWLTFPSPDRSLKGLLDSLVVPITVDYMLYDDMKKYALENLGKLDFKRLPSAMGKDIAKELGNYQHEWRPEVNLDIPDNWRRTAEFLLGGFIFSGYAQASNSDHIIQSKRSRLFTELMVPENEPTRWGHHKEQKLFEAFKKYCKARQDVDLDEFTYAPNILPLLLKDTSRKGKTPMHLLDAALNFREEDIGRSYKNWIQKQREIWSLGENDQKAEKEVAEILTTLDRQLSDKFKGKDSTLNMEVGASTTRGLSFKLSKNISVSAINRWIQGWYLKNLPINQHRKLMYRMYMADASYDRMDFALKKLWWGS